MGAQFPLPKRAQPPIFGPYVLQPNGTMDQDVTWPRSKQHCVKWGPSCPPKKGAEPPIQFRPMSIVAKWLHRSDAAWYRGRPGLGHIALDVERAPPPQKGAQPSFLAHGCCGQTVGWIKMPLDMEVGLGPGHIVGPSHPLAKWAQPPPIFCHIYCSQTVAHLSYC